MEKVITSLIAFVIALCINAQKDVTQFLGIPIDGSKSDMVQKLKAKGFRTNPYNEDVLDGEFNGVDVSVFIATHHDKVCRIMVRDANSVDERSIQIRFNELCHQFENNSKYMTLGSGEFLIPDNENIYLGIKSHKRYEAIYYQKPSELPDTALMKEKLMSIFLEKYKPEELANLTEEMKWEIAKTSVKYMKELYFKKSVWFMISENFGKYYITMFYDNEYNRANGEDL